MDHLSRTISFPAILEIQKELIPIDNSLELNCKFPQLAQPNHNYNLIDKNGTRWVVCYYDPSHVHYFENYLLPRLTKKNLLSIFHKNGEYQLSWKPPKNLKNISFQNLFQIIYQELSQKFIFKENIKI